MHFTPAILLVSAALASLGGTMPIEHEDTLVVRVVNPKCLPPHKRDIEARAIAVGVGEVRTSPGATQDLTASALVTCYAFAVAGKSDNMGGLKVHVLAHLTAAGRDDEFEKLEKEVNTFGLSGLTGVMSPPDLEGPKPEGWTQEDQQAAADALLDYASKFSHLIGSGTTPSSLQAHPMEPRRRLRSRRMARFKSAKWCLAWRRT
ncbi:hypothetical protein C8F04DRAFT_1154952 [Mycena alexandri]|uniref:Uncharacterized protein n=1 Tax=Mycena alexandri TaxID=1745969 RepID=A0AAD6WM48_9AGAR|nr:hypothetical protein C8F04DRAFT_1154952 [Mycena alexandri]